MLPLFPFLLLLAGPNYDIGSDDPPQVLLDTGLSVQGSDLSGSWRVDRFQWDGVEEPPHQRLSITVNKDGQYFMEDMDGLGGIYELEIKKTSELCLNELTAISGDRKFKGIFYLCNDRLKIALNIQSNERPQSFRADPENRPGLMVYTLRRMSFLECLFEDAGSYLEDRFLSAGDALEAFLEEFIVPKGNRKRRVGGFHIEKIGEIQEWKIQRGVSLYSGQELHLWRTWYTEARLACSGLFECDLWRGIRPRVRIESRPNEEREFLDIAIEVRVRGESGKQGK